MKSLREAWTAPWIIVMAVLIGACISLILSINHDVRRTNMLDALCKRGGFDERVILGDGRAYCVEYYTDLRIVPFETAAAEVGE